MQSCIKATKMMVMTDFPQFSQDFSDFSWKRGPKSTVKFFHFRKLVYLYWNGVIGFKNNSYHDCKQIALFLQFRNKDFSDELHLIPMIVSEPNILL